ncbi:hypothetical protein NXX18_20610 [Bacteroides fragilis]|nr:hypothetical protein [Bacteroides fragilis]
MDVTALGTAFEVFEFDGDESVETVLLNGKVKVEPKDHKEQIKGEYILQPNEIQLQVNGDIRLDRVDANLILLGYWRTVEL